MTHLKDLFSYEPDRLLAINVLKHAVGAMRTKATDFVCHAIELDMFQTDKWVVACLLREEVQSRLAGFYVAEDWLKELVGVPKVDFTESRMRAWRIKWIKSMLKELK